MSKSDADLLAPWEERSDGVFTSFSPTGDRHCKAIINAVQAHYHRLSGRPDVTEESLFDFVDKQVTLITTGENMFGTKMLKSQQGKLFTGAGGALGIMPKGARSKGFRVRTETVLDVFTGYVPDVAQASVDAVRAHFPQLRAITEERLQEIPAQSEMMTFCAFGTWSLPGETPCYDTWLLAAEYLRDEDIVDSTVLLCRPESGFSEHGSQLGRHLMHAPGWAFGEVVGFRPISFGEAIGLCNLDHDDAVAEIFPTGALVA